MVHVVSYNCLLPTKCAETHVDIYQCDSQTPMKIECKNSYFRSTRLYVCVGECSSFSSSKAEVSHQLFPLSKD